MLQNPGCRYSFVGAARIFRKGGTAAAAAAAAPGRSGVQSTSMMLYLRPVFIFLSLISFCSGDLDVDRQALLQLYNSTGGVSWVDNAGWSTNDANLSNWDGLTLNGSVVWGIHLEGNNLKGKIPESIGNFTGLEILHLGTNFLSGPIPPEIGKLDLLRELYLDSNSLTGPIPPELVGMESLEGLWLHENDLDGDLPPELGGFPVLETLNLGSNAFTGEIPQHFGNLTQCMYLVLMDNLLVGSIPEGIGTLVSHHYLNRALLLQTNYLTGSVPDALASVNSYFSLDLSWNLLDDWPDQRNDTTTGPPQPSSSLDSSAATPAPVQTTSSLDLSGATPTPSPSSGGGTYIGDGSDTSHNTAPPAGADGSASSSSSISPVSIDDVTDSSAPSSSPVPTAAIVGGALGGAAMLAGAMLFCVLCKRRGEKEVRNRHAVHQMPADGKFPERRTMSSLALPGADGIGSDEEKPKTRTSSDADGSFSFRNPTLQEERAGIPTTGNRAWRADHASAGLQREPPPRDRRLLFEGNSDDIVGRNEEEISNSRGSGRGVEGAGSSVLDIASAALAAAESLAQQSFIPGVREAATVVAGLARLAGDHQSNAGDMQRRVRWCRSIVLTLQRAGDVLGKADDSSGEAERILLEDVRESISDMVMIMESYRHKNAVSKVFVSTLCKRRQEEAEAAINAAVQRLQLSLQVRAGNKLEDMGQAMQEGLQHQRRLTEESRAKSRKDRRDHRLDQLEIPATDVDITDEVLGRGGFGTVFLADFNGRNAAAKVVVFDADDHSSGDDDNDDHLHSGRPLGVHEQAKLEQQHRAKRRAKSRSRQRKAFMRELEAMKRLTGPHTVSIYGAITSSQDRLVLVMELLPGGDLRYRLRKARQPLDEATVMRIVKDVCSGMAFLHAKKTVHGDLKSANILFDTSGRAKIADFGTSLWTQYSTRLATYTTKPGESIGMSLPWAAPEVLNRKGSSFESDVYSFGMVIWECLTRKIPWTKIPGVDMLLLAVTGGERPDIPDHASPVLASLMTSCWAQAAATRPTFRGILVELASHHVDGGKQYGRGDARTKQSASCQRSSVIAAATEMEDLEKGTFSQEWRQWSHSTMTLSAPSAPTMASSVGSTSRADERKRGEELRRSPPPSYWDH